VRDRSVGPAQEVPLHLVLVGVGVLFLLVAVVGMVITGSLRG